MYTVKAAAPKLGISASKTYQLVQRREIGHFKIGGKILFSDRDIEDFLKKRRVEAVEIARN